MMNTIKRAQRRKFSLRSKTILALLITAFTLICTVHLTSNTVLLHSFAKLDISQATSDVEKMGALLNERIEALNTKLSDWSTWDDTYQYISDQNEEYVTANLDPSALVMLDINFMAFVNQSRQMINCLYVDLGTQSVMPVPSDLCSLITQTPLGYHENLEGNISGVVKYRDRAIMVASRPILTSKSEGPINGALVFGRYLDQPFVNSLGSASNMDLTFFVLNDQQFEEDSTLSSKLTADAPILIQVYNNNIEYGYLLISDPKGEAVALLQANIPRNIYLKGKAATDAFAIWSVGLILVAFVVSLLLLELLVVRRLTKLGAEVVDVQIKGPRERVTVSGNDEITTLSENINGTLKSLDHAQLELQNTNETLESRVQERTIELEKKQTILAENEAYAKKLLNSVSVGIVIINPETHIIQDVNDTVAHLIGRDKNEIVDSICHKYICSAEVGKCPITDLKQTVDNSERILRDCHGKSIPVIKSVIPIVKNGKTLLIETFTDITVRKKFETELISSKELIDSILASEPNAVLVTNKENQIILANEAFYIMCNQPIGSALNKTIADYQGLEAIIPVIEEIKSGKQTNCLIEFNCMLDGHHNTLLTNIIDMKVDRTLIIFRNVTQERAKQERLYLTDRLSSVGEMAAGVAHELNNPLTSVVSLAELILEGHPPSDMEDDLHTISAEARRAGGIVKNLLSFARKHEPTKKPVQMNRVIEDVLQLRNYEQTLNNIKVECHLDSGLPEVMADYFQMQQVFLNIILNAEQAMVEAHQQGILKITSQKIDNAISISVKDDGPGISPENMHKLFSPFFTTKEVGKGTGLGLSICYGIVTAHNGRIYVQSQIGNGTTFVIEIPIIKSDIGDANYDKRERN
jgi:PAS domain S-box-containing protein